METQDYIKETDRQLNNTNFYKQLIQTMCLPVDHQLQISVNMPKSYAKEQQICNKIEESPQVSLNSQIAIWYQWATDYHIARYLLTKLEHQFKHHYYNDNLP